MPTSSRSLCLPPARMHFCVSAARVSEPGIAPAHLLTSARRSPRKMGTNWFMPALVNSRFGESGSSDDEGTIVCCFSRKKSRKDWRIWALVIMAGGGGRGGGGGGGSTSGGGGV